MGIFRVVLAREDKSAASKSGCITAVSNLAPILGWISVLLPHANAIAGYHARRGPYFQARIPTYRVAGTVGA